MTAEILARINVVEQLCRDLSEHKKARDEEAAEKLKRRPKRARILKCTQELFNLLPGMVSRSEFQDWTGLNEHDLRAAVNCGDIDVYKPEGHAVARYYKREIARLTGFKL